MAAVNYFFSCPLEGRAAIISGIVLLLLLLLHTPILKILSLIPFLLKWVFREVYLLLEWSVSVLHKLLGGTVYSVGNGLAACGRKIDTGLEHWYQAWHMPKSWWKYAFVVTAVCTMCYLSVIAPIFFHVEHSSWAAKGWTVYLHAESTLTDFFEEHSWYNPNPPVPAAATSELEEEFQEVQEAVQISMTVQVSSALRIRDIPSTRDGTTLDSVGNGEIVIWNGELSFGFAEGKQEPWAKVTAESGSEGWVRLYYLRPEEDAELILTVRDVLTTDAVVPPA